MENRLRGPKGGCAALGVCSRIDPFSAERHNSRFIMFYYQFKSQLLGITWVVKHQQLQMCGLKFQVASRCRELQL